MTGTLATQRIEHPEELFWRCLMSQLLRSCYKSESARIDNLRFRTSFISTVKAKATDLLAATFGLHRAPLLNADVVRIEGLANAYLLLEDHLSKDLFIKLLAYRILGPRHVRLPRDTPDYWERRRSVREYLARRCTISTESFLGSLDLYSVGGVRLHSHPLSIWNTFCLEQYRCPRAQTCVNAGDVVIDGGGCWGDTALYFAQNGAQVYCFECMPANIEILRKNLALNPVLNARITVVEKALWSRSGDQLTFADAGPGSHAVATGRGTAVETQSVDDFVFTNSLERLDFIKLDIEGAEPEALVGAEKAIKKFRPKLAICLYHDAVHLASIPNWLASLDLGYRFYLDHFTTHSEETVLFARSDLSQGGT